jgi:hypothetical protein
MLLSQSHLGITRFHKEKKFRSPPIYFYLESSLLNVLPIVPDLPTCPSIGPIVALLLNLSLSTLAFFCLNIQTFCHCLLAYRPILGYLYPFELATAAGKILQHTNGRGEVRLT